MQNFFRFFLYCTSDMWLLQGVLLLSAWRKKKPFVKPKQCEIALKLILLMETTFEDFCSILWQMLIIYLANAWRQLI